MRPGGVEAVAAARTFLEETILEAVPPEHRGELRAALKNLRGAELELAGLAGVLRAETDELAELCDAAYAAVGTPASGLRGAAEAADLAELREAHDAARRAATDAILALQTLARPATSSSPPVGGKNRGEGADPAEALALLARFYAALGRHAERRLPWQSVFPAVPTQGALR